jgi:osmotically-inducible protein OsmY
LSGLSNHAVFDWITFGFKGRTLVLNGFASRPILKDYAGRAVKGIEGITGVDNEIKVTYVRQDGCRCGCNDHSIQGGVPCT